MTGKATQAACHWILEQYRTSTAFKSIMNSSSELMYRARQVSNLGGFMSGVNNNGAHSANGIRRNRP